MVDLGKYGFNEQDTIETWDGISTKVEFPKPIAKYRLNLEEEGKPIEKLYFWIIKNLKANMGFTEIHKITDTFSASEMSSMWGAAQAKIGLQQQNASNYLRGISEMLKGLFQLVRELRIIDERLQFYKDTYEKNENAIASEITLKGIWVDMVEGGAKSPASVYGMAQQIGFTILPDLFFRVSLEEGETVDEAVEVLEFNEKVKEVLKRKLRTFYEWKTRTYKELTHRRSWNIKYLRQHYNTIRLYMQWAKPYLKYSKRLSMKDTKHPGIVSAFETTLIELELLCKKPIGKCNTVFVIHFEFVSEPSMDYQRDQYQHKGPQHMGSVEMVMRSYAWTDEQIEAYIKMREDEELELVGEIDVNLKETLESLGDELKAYLEEAGEKFPKPEEYANRSKRKRSSALDPFIGIFDGFKEMFAMFTPKKEKKETVDSFKLSNDTRSAKNAAIGLMWVTYKNCKKAHKMVTW